MTMEGLKMKYFVLKPEGDNEYAQASRFAMLAYANSIAPFNQQLANDIYDLVNKEVRKITKQNNQKIKKMNRTLLIKKCESNIYSLKKEQSLLRNDNAHEYGLFQRMINQLYDIITDLENFKPSEIKEVCNNNDHKNTCHLIANCTERDNAESSKFCKKCKYYYAD